MALQTLIGSSSLIDCSTALVSVEAVTVFNIKVASSDGACTHAEIPVAESIDVELIVLVTTGAVVA